MSPATPPAPASPPPTPRNYISRVWAEGGGYIDGVDLPFSPKSNAICGSHGTGKSTALTFLRYVLALPVPLEREEHEASLLATNLGPGRAHVELFGADGSHYILSRGGGEKEPRVDFPKSAQGIPWATLCATLFPIRFVGHGELALAATSGLARLDLVTRFAQAELAPIERDLARARRDLDDNGIPLVRLNREIIELKKKCAPLPPQRARLEELKKAAGGDPALLDEANARKALRERERMMLDRAEREAAWLASEVAVLAMTARRRLGQVADDEATRGPNAPLLADVSAHVVGLGGMVESLATRIGEECERGRALVASRGRALAERHAPEDDACRALLAMHESNTARAFERLTLEKSVAELERAQAELGAHENERAQLILARSALCARLRSLLRARGETLDRTGKGLGERLGGRVKIVFEREAERGRYRALLGELTARKRFEKEDLDTVSKSITPDDLCAQVMRGDTSVLEDKLGSKAVAMRLASVLLEAPNVYHLDTVDLPDLPTISLKDGTEWKPSQELSSGQRIVLFTELLLLDNRGPLVMDQPEDNVANPYLAQHLCRVFAEAQKDAQLLFVTHIGNVPILGRFERVFEMAADGAHGRVAAAGEASEVLTPMENNFEGGARSIRGEEGVLRGEVRIRPEDWPERLHHVGEEFRSPVRAPRPSRTSSGVSDQQRPSRKRAAPGNSALAARLASRGSVGRFGVSRCGSCVGSKPCVVLRSRSASSSASDSATKPLIAQASDS